MNKEEFINECEKINIKITDEILKKLDDFYRFMIDYNKKINLTRIIEENEVYLKHFYDSLTINKIINLNNYETLCDVGTGGGFPGIVLKIVYPHLNITLIESSNKKCTYLNELIKFLDLNNIEVICIRSEEYAKNNREKYDIVVSREVANLRVLSELCIPLVKKNGYFIALKANVNEEIEESSNILKALDSKIERVIEFNLPYEESIRNILLIHKLKETNIVYPRSYKNILEKDVKIS